MIAENDAQRAETSSDAEEHNKISKEDRLDGGFSLAHGRMSWYVRAGAGDR